MTLIAVPWFGTSSLCLLRNLENNKMHSAHQIKLISYFTPPIKNGSVSAFISLLRHDIKTNHRLHSGWNTVNFLVLYFKGLPFSKTQSLLGNKMEMTQGKVLLQWLEPMHKQLLRVFLQLVSNQRFRQSLSYSVWLLVMQGQYIQLPLPLWEYANDVEI